MAKLSQSLAFTCRFQLELSLNKGDFKSQMRQAVLISAAYTEQRGGPWQDEHAANTTVRGKERNFLAFRHFLFP